MSQDAVENPGFSASPSSAAGRSAARDRNARGQGDRLRGEILAALGRLVSDEARMRPLPLSLREVAAEAGVTAPAIYRHFANKEELVRAAVEDGYARLAGEMDEADAGEAAAGGSPVRRLAAQAHAYCGFAAREPGCFRMMFQPRTSASVAADGEPDPAVWVASRWRTAVNRLRDHGLRMSQTPERAAMSLWASVHGRLVLAPHVDSVWELGDVHQFVEALVASLAYSESPPSQRP